MNHLDYFSALDHVVETCIVGSGGFGRSFIAQGLRMSTMNVRVAVDVDAQIAARSLAAVGVAESDIALCRSPVAAQAAWHAGKYVASDDLANVVGLPIDAVVEATGNPEAGARHGRLAIEAGHHLVLVSKEVDSVVGPYLAHLARERGKIATPVDGDQPSLLIDLVTWAETLGLEIVAAGKSSEYDFVFDAAKGELTCNGQRYTLPNLAEFEYAGGRDVTDVAARRAAVCTALPQRAVPDLCELLVVANSTGLAPDRADLHAPILRVPEVPSFFAETAEGGLLARPGALDVFHCLRRPDEASFAGGVFIVVRCVDAPTWKLLAEKGHVVSRDGKRAMIFNPRHLLGLEAATSVLEAVVHGRSCGALVPRPHFDLVARAAVRLHAGAELAMGGHHHTIAGTQAELHPGQALSPAKPLPFYLAANRRLVRDVEAGALITLADVEVDESSELLSLRRRQDALFFPA